jgi:hypothetical protein
MAITLVSCGVFAYSLNSIGNLKKNYKKKIKFTLKIKRIDSFWIF